MITVFREKFATQVSPEILSELRALAESEGRQIQVLIEEALIDLIAKRKGHRRSHDTSVNQAGHEGLGSPHKKLAE